MGQAFTYLKNRTEKLHGANCKLETGEYLDKINSRTVATNLYNIAQKTIKNAIIHGEAEHIKIVLIDHEQQLYLHIKDDGRGFNPESQQNDMGLSNAENRSVPQRRTRLTPTAMSGISTLTGLVLGGGHVKHNPQKE